MAFNYVDRQVLAIVLEDVKRDIDLTDTQLGLLSGIAFSLFYAAMGIPIARWADRGDRVKIIALTTALWTVFVVACGWATSFIALLVMRVGVAVGEAGCLPASQSLLTDKFSRAERPRAFAIYALGSPLSVIAGFFLAGWINQYYGWRATFVVLGLPGIALALLSWMTLREPRRIKKPQISESRPEEVPVSSQAFWRSAHALFSIPAYRHLLVANVIMYFFIYGIAIQWQPAFFVRSYGMTTGELGTWYMFVWALLGGGGTWIGGLLSSSMAHNEQRQLLWMGASISLFGVISFFVYLAPHKYLSLGFMAAATPFYTATFGPLMAIVQTLVQPRLRATAVALLLFFANLLGMGFGGLATGMLSDWLAPTYGQDSLRYALLLLTPGFFWVALHLLVASRTVSRDIASTDGESRAIGSSTARGAHVDADPTSGRNPSILPVVE